MAISSPLSLAHSPHPVPPKPLPGSSTKPIAWGGLVRGVLRPQISFVNSQRSSDHRPHSFSCQRERRSKFQLPLRLSLSRPMTGPPAIRHRRRQWPLRYRARRHGMGGQQEYYVVSEVPNAQQPDKGRRGARRPLRMNAACGTTNPNSCQTFALDATATGRGVWVETVPSWKYSQVPQVGHKYLSSFMQVRFIFA